MNAGRFVYGVALAAHVLAALASSLIALVGWSVVPGAPFYDSCGLQLLFILPLAIVLLAAAVPALWADHRLGLSWAMRGSVPVAALATLLLEPFSSPIHPPVSVLLAVATLLAFGGLATVAYLFVWRLKWQRS